MTDRQTAVSGQLAKGRPGIAQARCIVGLDAYAFAGNIHHITLRRKSGVVAVAQIPHPCTVCRMLQLQIFTFPYLHPRGLRQQLWNKLLRLGGQGKKEDGQPHYRPSDA